MVGQTCSPSIEHACDRCRSSEELASWHPELPCFAGPCDAGSSHVPRHHRRRRGMVAPAKRGRVLRVQARAARRDSARTTSGERRTSARALWPGRRSSAARRRLRRRRGAQMTRAGSRATRRLTTMAAAVGGGVARARQGAAAAEACVMWMWMWKHVRRCPVERAGIPSVQLILKFTTSVPVHHYAPQTPLPHQQSPQSSESTDRTPVPGTACQVRVRRMGLFRVVLTRVLPPCAGFEGVAAASSPTRRTWRALAPRLATLSLAAGRSCAASLAASSSS